MSSSNLSVVIVILVFASSCAAEGIMTMQKKEAFSNEVHFKRVIRDVDNGSGTDEQPNILRQHTDIHVFRNDSNPSISLVWSGSEGVLLALTTMSSPIQFAASGLYRSTNYGRSFTDISDKINHDRIRNSHGLLISPVDSTNVILVSDQNMYYLARSVIHISVDSGESFQEKTLPFFLDPTTVIFNSHNPLKLLGLANGKSALWMSHDFGYVWRHVSDYVLQIRWDPLDEDTFYYLKDPSGKMTRGLFTNELYRGKTGTMQSTKVAEHVYSFGIQGAFLFMSVEYLNRNGSRVMHVSRDRGVSWDAAQIPMINKRQFYSLLDMSEGMVFVHVDSLEGQGDGTIYTSDDKGVIYSKSLEHHLYPSLGSVTDFYKVSSLQGVYITSQLEHSESTIHSVITYNKGGNWQKIDPPKGSVCPSSEKECRLQIHSLFSKSKGVNMPEFPKSTSSATGIIIAHGNLGDGLNFNPPDVFISNDGGYSWIQPEELKGPHFYAIGDSGGLLYAVTSKLDTNTIFYSTDEGQSWEEYAFSDNPIVVTGLSVEPGSHTPVLGLWGWDKRGDGAWRTVTIDFKPILKGRCRKQDYENWKAHESNTMYDSDSCLLGADFIFTRRKNGTVCENGKDYQPSVNVKPCECQKTDYLCDYGYSRSNLDCVQDDDFQTSNRDICMEDQEDVIKTQGYRKIPGDHCQGGFDPSSEVVVLHKSCVKMDPDIEKKENFGVDKDTFSEFEPSDEDVKKAAHPVLIAFLVIAIIALVGALAVLIRRRHKSRKRVMYVPLATSDHATNQVENSTSLLDETVGHHLARNGYQKTSTQAEDFAQPISYHDDSDEDLLVS